jgi:hypothetical protein
MASSRFYKVKMDARIKHHNLQIESNTREEMRNIVKNINRTLSLQTNSVPSQLTPTNDRMNRNKTEIFIARYPHLDFVKSSRL